VRYGLISAGWFVTLITHRGRRNSIQYDLTGAGIPLCPPVPVNSHMVINDLD